MRQQSAEAIAVLRQLASRWNGDPLLRGPLENLIIPEYLDAMTGPPPAIFPPQARPADLCEVHSCRSAWYMDVASGAVCAGSNPAGGARRLPGHQAAELAIFPT
jgi:hypothetical protein